MTESTDVIGVMLLSIIAIGVCAIAGEIVGGVLATTFGVMGMLAGLCAFTITVAEVLTGD